MNLLANNILNSICSGEWESIEGLDYATLVMKDGMPKPNEASFLASKSELQAVYDSQAYSRSRATAYAALNQFEMQFDDAANSTTTWIDAINAIKLEFPK